MSCGTLVSASRLNLSLTGMLPSLSDLSRSLQLDSRVHVADPQPRGACPPVWPLSRSLAATQEITFVFFSYGYLDVSVPRVPSVRLWIHLTVTGSSPAGFPHSEIRESLPACGSSRLIAACHVLLRRMVPWHPPCAPCSLIFSSLDPETNCFFFLKLAFTSLATGLF